MVEYTINVDLVFASLADATRRDILSRVLKHPRSIGELAEAHKDLSFAGVAKHVGVLAEAQLVVKERKGRQQMVRANAKAITAASTILQKYQAMWDARFAALDELLRK